MQLKVKIQATSSILIKKNVYDGKGTRLASNSNI